MAQSSGGDGFLKPVLVAVIIFALTGGSAPFWWSYFFPPKPPIPSRYEGQPQDIPDHGKDGDKVGPTYAGNGIGACALGALKPDNSFHNTAAPNGSWDWNCDGQVTPNMDVCETLQPSQCTPNTNATHSRGGFCSQKREVGCPAEVPKCGTSGYIYPCFLENDGRCHAGGYETGVTVSCR